MRKNTTTPVSRDRDCILFHWPFNRECRLGVEGGNAYIPHWGPVESLCNVVKSFPMPAHEEELVFHMRTGMSIQRFELVLEAAPLRSVVLMFKEIVRVISLVYQTETCCNLLNFACQKGSLICFLVACGACGVESSTEGKWIWGLHSRRLPGWSQGHLARSNRPR